MGIYFLLLIYFLFFSLYTPKHQKNTRLKGVGIIMMVVVQMQITLIVDFLEHKNFSQDTTYVKDKVTYEAEVSYYLTNRENYTMYYKLHTLGFEDPSQITYQQTKLQTTEAGGKYFSIEPYTDQAGNLFYLIELNLTAYERVRVAQIFEITRMNIIVNTIEHNEIRSNRIKKYEKFLTNETDLEVHNSKLRALSKKIVGDEKSPLVKAEKIYQWIGDTIKYDRKYKGGGALNTYLERAGTCGDFTDLMITLLRIQQIPARKVHGFFLDDIWPKKGDEVKIRDAWFEHSWAEYFVPEIGWVACEPTFGIHHPNYFAAIDCSHFRTYTGEFVAPQHALFVYNYSLPEQVLWMLMNTYDLYYYDTDATISLKVLEIVNTNELYEQMSFLLMIFRLSLALSGIIFVISLILDKRRDILNSQSERGTQDK